jgi:hypothetical protein
VGWKGCERGEGEVASSRETEIGVREDADATPAEAHVTPLRASLPDVASAPRTTASEAAPKTELIAPGALDDALRANDATETSVRPRSRLEVLPRAPRRRGISPEASVASPAEPGPSPASEIVTSWDF